MLGLLLTSQIEVSGRNTITASTAALFDDLHCLPLAAAITCQKCSSAVPRCTFGFVALNKLFISIHVYVYTTIVYAYMSVRRLVSLRDHYTPGEYPKWHQWSAMARLSHPKPIVSAQGAEGLSSVNWSRSVDATLRKMIRTETHRSR